MSSYVLLSACGTEEPALEVNGRGVFTRALLQTMEDRANEEISYDDLIMKMPALQW